MANAKKVITTEMIKQAEQLASKGLSKSQIAMKLGMGKSTIYDKLQENKELSEAIKRGTLEAIGDITNALYESAMDGNTTSMIFFLKNRGGWKDKTEVDMTAEVRLEKIEVVFL